MAEKPETLFRRRFNARLEREIGFVEAGGPLWVESIQQKAIGGTPDELACMRGLFLAFEIKATPQDKPTALQKLKLGHINKTGGLGFVVNPDTMDDVIARVKVAAQTIDCPHCGR